jgi:hypothetical protein
MHENRRRARGRTGRDYSGTNETIRKDLPDVEVDNMSERETHQTYMES